MSLTVSLGCNVELSDVLSFEKLNLRWPNTVLVSAFADANLIARAQGFQKTIMPSTE